MEWSTDPGAIYRWRKWFAWRPVELHDQHKIVWLEEIERRWVGGVASGEWMYRRKDGTK